MKTFPDKLKTKKIKKKKKNVYNAPNIYQGLIKWW